MSPSESACSNDCNYHRTVVKKINISDRDYQRVLNVYNEIMKEKKNESKNRKIAEHRLQDEKIAFLEKELTNLRRARKTLEVE